MINQIDLKYEIKNLKISELDFDYDNYQRKTSEIKIKNLVRNFDWKAFGFVIVNIRDGKKYVVDGQHRIVAAARMKFKEVPCIVYEDFTVEEEAILFINCQVNRNSVKSFEKYQALYTAGDKKTHEIQEVMEKYGIKPCNNGSQRKKGYINSIGILYRIYDSKGRNWLDTILKIITLIWKYKDNTWDKDALTSNMISGMYIFLNRTYNQLNEKKFIEKMKRIPARKVLNTANRNTATYGKTKASNVARAILEEYNNRNQYKLNVII